MNLATAWMGGYDPHDPRDPNLLAELPPAILIVLIISALLFFVYTCYNSNTKEFRFPSMDELIGGWVIFCSVAFLIYTFIQGIAFGFVTLSIYIAIALILRRMV